MMTRIEEGSNVFVHASDIQMLDDEAVKQVIAWQPSVDIISSVLLTLWDSAVSCLKQTGSGGIRSYLFPQAGTRPMLVVKRL